MATESIGSNSTHDDDDDVTRRLSLNYSLPTMVVVATLLTVVIATTAFGNLLVGVALVRFRYLRTTSNILIGNLALSDFLLATTILPLSTLNECLGYWVLGRAMCNVWLIADVLYCTASLWNICVIAFDRFTATLFPIWYRERRSVRRAAALYVAGVWSVAGAICLPPLVPGWTDLEQNYVYDPRYDVTRCVIFQTPSYVLYSACGSFFVPFVLTLFLYVQIFVVLRKRIRRMRSSASTEAMSSSSWQRGGGSRRRRRRPSSNRKWAGGGGTPEVELNSFVGLSSAFAGGENTTTTLSKSFLSSESVATATAGHSLVAAAERPTRLNIDYVIKEKTTVTSPLSPPQRKSSASPSPSPAQFLSRLRLTSWYGSHEEMRRSPPLPPLCHLRMSVSPADSQKSKNDVIVRRPEPEDKDRIRIIATDSDNEVVTTLLVINNLSNGRRRGTRRRSSYIHRWSRDDHLLSCCCCHRSPKEVQRTVTATTTLRHDSPLPMTSSSGLNHRSSLSVTPAGEAGALTPAGEAGALTPTPSARQRSRRLFEQREMQATVRMAVIIAFFCGMWIGFFVVYVVHGFIPGCFVPRELDAFFFWLGYSNSSVNPILYTIFNDDFRRAFLKILRRRRKNRNKRSLPGHRL